MIARGLIPRGMDDKWFIYVESATAYFHRSWTGTCVYQVEFTQTASGHVVKNVLVNRNPDQYKSSDNSYDVALLNWVIEIFLLGRTIQFPGSPQNEPQ